MMTATKYRFAPSPTGFLHVGGARTALYNYLMAQKEKGTFLLRLEDTDEERNTNESVQAIFDGLSWLGLHWGEGVLSQGSKGSLGPYRQSERQVLYNKYAEQLIDRGRAYYCFLTDEEIEGQRQKALQENRPPHVDSPYKNWSKVQALEKMNRENLNPVVRFKTEEKKRDYLLKDLVRGDVVFPSDMVGDFVLIRSNGMPVYNFCCVIDDALMKVTHVLRAEEHLSNTLRQLMLYEAFNFDPPKFGHLSLILGEDKQKLSKRHGATSVSQYKELGYLPEALNNFLALLGWSSPLGQEILSMDELVNQFSLNRFTSSPAVFDEKKLRWMNSQHLRLLPLNDLWARIEPLLKMSGYILPEDQDWKFRSLELLKHSMELLTDAIELYRPLSEGELSWGDKVDEVLSWPTSRIVIEEWKKKIELSPEWLSEEDFLKIQDEVKVMCQVQGKFLFMPIRVAVIAKPQGAELKHLVPLIKRQTLIQRAEKALNYKG